MPARSPARLARLAMPRRWLPAHERQANSNEFLVGYGRDNSQRNNSSFRGRDSFDDANLDSSEMRGHFPEAFNFNWLILKLNQFICEERSALHVWGLRFKYQENCYVYLNRTRLDRPHEVRNTLVRRCKIRLQEERYQNRKRGLQRVSNHLAEGNEGGLI